MRTPHVATLYPQDEVLAGKLVRGYEDGAPVAVECQVTPSDAATVYNDFGAEVKDGWLLMANPGLQDLFVVGAQVEYLSRRFTVAAPPRVFVDFGNCDHYSVALEGRND